MSTKNRRRRLRQAQPTSATSPSGSTETSKPVEPPQDEPPPAANVGSVSLEEVMSLEFDVRAPLRNIAGYLGMATPPPGLASLVPAVMAAMHQTERLIESMADLAHSRAGLLLRRSIDLAGFWQQVQTECAGLVGYWHPGGVLQFAINTTPAMIMGDEAALRRVLLNLIESSLYWSDHGEIVVVSGQSHSAWVVEVINGEPGLPPRSILALQDPAIGGPLGLVQAWEVVSGHGGWLKGAADRVRMVIPLDR